MRGLTSRFDQLALLGKPLDHEDKIEYVIDGLPEEYKSVTYQVEGRDTSPSIIEIHEKLINKEAKLLSLSPTVVTPVPVSANVAITRPKNHQHRNFNRNWNNNNNKASQQSYQSQSNDTNQNRGYQGRCQICSVFGHSARKCPQFGPRLKTPTLPHLSVHGSQERTWRSQLTTRAMLG